MQQRKLDFSTCDEVIAEIQRLQDGGYQRTKKWNLTQNCQHLTATMNIVLEGADFRLPWILRATIVKWIFRYCLKRRRLFAGAPTVKQLEPTAVAEADDSQEIERCIATCRKAAEFQGPIVDYPLLNHVEVEDWQQFMWIHAAHHLGFLVPDKS